MHTYCCALGVGVQKEVEQFLIFLPFPHPQVWECLVAAIRVKYTTMEASVKDAKYAFMGILLAFMQLCLRPWVLESGWLVGLWRLLRRANHIPAPCGREQGDKWEGSTADSRYQAGAGA